MMEPQSPATVIDVVRSMAERRPSKRAFVNLRDGRFEDKQATFGQLDEGSRRIAAGLQQHGVHGERILLLFPQGLDFVYGFLGCIYAGAIAVPAHTPKPGKRSWATLEAIIDDCTPRLILTCRAVLDNVRNWSRGSEKLEALELLAIEDLEAASPAGDWRRPEVTPGDLTFLQYTSGSTSTPKGVMVSHGNLIHNAALTARHMGHHDQTVMVSWLPLFHDLGLIGIVFQNLFIGGTCYFMSPAAFSGNPSLWLQAISRYRAQTSMSSDFGYRLCARSVRPEQLEGLDLSCWKNALNAAEPIHASTLREFTERFAPVGFVEEAFFPAYGLAEATLLSTTSRLGVPPVVLRVDREALEAGRLVPRGSEDPDALEIVSSGRPSSDMDVEIVDPETGEALPDGTMGEVWVAGGSIAQGYWRKPEETERTFRRSPAGAGRPAFLRTGDLGIRWNEEIFITGRLKDLIILRGRNVYPQDVELTVKLCHPAFATVNGAAFAVPAPDGEETVVVVHEIERTFRNAVDLDELRRIAREAVWQDHEVRVADVVVINPASLPKTTSGKVQRRLTRELYAAGELDVFVPRAGGPRTDVRVASEPAADAGAAPGAAQARRRAGLAREHLEWAREWGESRLNPQLMDERRTVPPYVVMDMGARGLLGSLVPQEYGGQDLGYFGTLKVVEQLSAVDLTVAHVMLVHNFLGLLPIVGGASPETKAEVLPMLAEGRMLAAYALTEPGAGSNPKALASTATPDGPGAWLLHGRKCYSGHASWAGVINTFAVELDAAGRKQGISAFLVRQGSRGLRMGPEATTMGMRGMVQSSFALDGVRVAERDRLGAPGAGMEVGQAAMTATRLPISVAAVGAMKRCVQLIHRYADVRQVSTGRLIENPSALLYLKQIVFDTFELETLIYRIAALMDAGRTPPMEVFHVAKIAAPETLWTTVDRTVQLLGGRGYTENNPAPRMMRDARVLRIFEGPTEALEAHLGARVFNQPAELDGFLREDLAQPELADRLRATVEALRDQGFGGAAVPFDRPVDRARWLQARAAPYVVRVVLHAFLLADRQARRRPQYAQVLEYSALRLAELERELFRLRALEASPFGPAEVGEALRGYLADIGDVEPSLPGEEWELDPLLRRDGAPHTPAAAVAVDQEPGAPAADGGVPPTARPVATVSLGSPVRPRTAPAPAPASVPSPTGNGNGGARAGNGAARPGRTAAELQRWTLDKIAELMHVPGQSVSAEDSFGALGIDSVMAGQLATAMGDELGIVVDPTIFWQYPTPARLAGHLEAGGAAGEPALARAPEPTAEAAPSGAAAGQPHDLLSALRRELGV